MARKSRIHVPGGVYHILLSGNPEEKIFYDDDDYLNFYSLLADGVERFNYKIHAFCLMEDQIHLVLEVGETPLSKIVQNFTFRHTRWINKKVNRKGSLFQGRYKATLIDPNVYLTELVRYVHLAPIRNAAVDTLMQYPWISHHTYLKLHVISWITTDRVLSEFSTTERFARQKYHSFIMQGIGKKTMDFSFLTNQNDRVLGDENFINTMNTLVEKTTDSASPGLEQIVAVVCDHINVDAKDLKSPSQARMLSEARSFIAWFAVKLGAARLSEIAKLFDRDTSTISASIARLEKNFGLQYKLQRLRGEILEKLNKLVFRR